MSQNLATLSVSKLAPLIYSRQISPVELTQEVFHQIEAVEPLVNAYITILKQQALADAHAAEYNILKGNYLGPFHGIPIGLKDMIKTRGIRTTAGSAILANCITNYDASCVVRLRQAGAILVGKQNCHEFAFGSTNNNLTFGPVHNPWNLEYIPGGSSGGSAAAVSASECIAAIGTDTGGSVRNPAACCGIVGLKPTYDRASTCGVFPLSWSMDTLGLLTKTVTDAALTLQIVAGYDPFDITTSSRPVPDYTSGIEDGIKGLLVGIPRNYFFDRIDSEVKERVESAIHMLTNLGAIPVEITLPNVELSLLCTYTIIFAEASSCHEPLLQNWANLYSPDVRLYLESGESLTATKYLKAQRLRTLIKQSLNSIMEHVDVIVAPTVPSPAVKIGQNSVVINGQVESITDAMFRYTCPFNLSGQPSLAVPCGFSENGLPISLQIVGRPFDEKTVLRVGRAFEASTKWHSIQPALNSIIKD
ncbi:amidase [Paenibacillus sedimenti]|uniref:amidase n=1 Tax=Paenibacillus sedimenti TaxID=2770274 RepID=UPI0028A23824|nr:amidase [Paenibacillus sedimenti]